VQLNVPDNPRLDMMFAKVESLEPWGTHVSCTAAATGAFRAGWEEMIPVTAAEAPRPQSSTVYDGNPCDICGALKLRRAGSCLVCDSCGTSTGC
jgi:hypothetical protein